MLQPGGLSERPAIVKMLWTWPSGLTFAFRMVLSSPNLVEPRPKGGPDFRFLARMNRTSRIGPSILRKDGTVFPGAMIGARTTCGLFVGGLDPPISGNTWH